jgi:hypothetical protein
MRYHVNRIAQTELDRARMDKQAEEIMADDTIHAVNVVMSSTHPRTDICNLWSKQDKYGLGPGIYPKESAPKPPFHPHCRCVLHSKRLIKTDKAKDNPASERQYLGRVMREEGASKAAKIIGGRAKLAAALTNAPIDSIVNIHRPVPYRLGRVGDNVGMRSEEFAAKFGGFDSATFTPAQREAADFVVSMGKNTGHEYGAAVAGDMVIDRFTSGAENRLDVPSYKSRGLAVEIHHNHPLGDGLSRADFASLLTREDLSSVFVHGHGGAVYEATKRAGATRADVTDAFSMAGAKLAEAADMGMISHADTATGIKMVIAGVLLESAGFITYTFNQKEVLTLARRIASL